MIELLIRFLRALEDMLRVWLNVRQVTRNMEAAVDAYQAHVVRQYVQQHGGRAQA